MKKFVLIVVLLLGLSISAQKYHRIGYVDMDYILKNVPTYIKAQNTLDTKVARWKIKIEDIESKLEKMRINLANEKAILTNDLIAEREEEIKLKEQELMTMKNFYFGSNGEMYNLRKKLVQPIQDMVFNAVQTIAKKKKLDYVYNKSSNLVMLYAKKKHDISKLVLKLISIDLKKQPKNKRIASKNNLLHEASLSDKQKENRDKIRKKKLEYAKRKQKQDSINKKRAQELLEKRKALREQQQKERQKNK